MPNTFDNVCVIGLGEIGSSVFEDLKKNPRYPTMLYGVDISEDVVAKMIAQGHQVSNSIEDIPPCDVYIVTIFDSSRIAELVVDIPKSRNPLIIIESTINPADLPTLVRLATVLNDGGYTLVTCPHRFNPRDPQHRVFNLDRIIGAARDQDKAIAEAFYARFMDRKLIHIADFHTAALSKIIENAYRYFDIVFAQELYRSLELKGFAFETIRSACNTKWNIHIKEAQKGVGGKCLPKDMRWFNNYFKDNVLTHVAELLNEQFVRDRLQW